MCFCIVVVVDAVLVAHTHTQAHTSTHAHTCRPTCVCTRFICCSRNNLALLLLLFFILIFVLVYINIFIYFFYCIFIIRLRFLLACSYWWAKNKWTLDIRNEIPALSFGIGCGFCLKRRFWVSCLGICSWCDPNFFPLQIVRLSFSIHMLTIWLTGWNQWLRKETI